MTNQSRNSNRPNVLHLFVDQMRGDAIAELGNPIIKTPNLDRLCREGVAFTNAFSPSPVCISARCSMIYGQYPMHTGCYENAPMPTDGRESMMGALTRAGYRTHGIGKCHFAPDTYAMRGFESRERQEEIVREPERDDYLRYIHEKGYKYVCEPHGVRGEMYYIPQVSQLPREYHPTQWIGDRGVEFINGQAESDRPWYLFSSFIHPHPPFAPPNPWHKLYRTPDMPLPNLPENFKELHTHINRRQNRYKYRDWGFDNNLVRTEKAYYYACISFIDYQIGRILETLEESGQLDNTLIVFTSDHGEHLGDYQCFGKRSMHDSCDRVPMIVRYPEKFPAGEVCKTAANLVDVAPTILSVAGTSMASHESDGVDLAELAAGNDPGRFVFGQISQGRETDEDRAMLSIYMAANRDWKYFYSAPDNKEFLFDRVNDPDETINLAENPEVAETKAMIKKVLIDHLVSGGETAGIIDGGWKQFPKQEIPADHNQGLIFQDSPWAETDIPGYGG